MNKPFDTPHRSMTAKRTLPRKKWLILIAGISIIIMAAGVLTWLHKSNSSTAYIQGDKYQALFLTNNQVYFGKLQRLNDESYRITDVYYVQSEAQTNAAGQAAEDPEKSQANKQPTLVKLGDELHGPMDEIFVRDDQVLFWENLKPDGKVSKAIEAHKKK